MSIFKSYVLFFGFIVLMLLIACRAEKAVDQGNNVTEQTHLGLNEINSSERPKRTLGVLLGALSRHGGGYYGGYHGGYQPYYGGYGHRRHHGHRHHHHRGYHHHGHYHGYGK